MSSGKQIKIKTNKKRKILGKDVYWLLYNLPAYYSAFSAYDIYIASIYACIYDVH